MTWSARVTLKLREALPLAFRKGYPVLDPKMPMISALRLLSYHETDALLLSTGPPEHRCISGFSALSNMLWLGPDRMHTFLEQKCEAASQPISALDADDDLSLILESFYRTRFGFARVKKGDDAALIGLFDLLELYASGLFSSSLGLAAVASPMFTMGSGAALKDALAEMLGRKCRRVFISGTRDFIWDYAIIEHILSPTVLDLVTHGLAKDIFETPISEIQTMEAGEVVSGVSLEDAASALRAGRGRCLVFNDMVVTPWDVVMKPYGAGALTVR